MHLSELAQRREFIYTCELGSPKGVNVQDFLDKADLIKDCVHAANIGDNTRAVMKAGSVAMCHLLKSQNMEPVMEISTRDRNRLALQSDILGAAILGIENILIDPGHDLSVGDHTDSKAVHDLDCFSLASVTKAMNEGQDMAGHDLDGAPSLCFGVMVTLDPEDGVTLSAEAKQAVACGAQFIQTQPIYDKEVLERFVESLGETKVPVIVGHMMLKSVSMASFINSNLQGVTIPEEMIRQLDGLRREELVEASLQLSVNFLKKIKPLCQGVHFMPAGWERYVPRIIEALG